MFRNLLENNLIYVVESIIIASIAIFVAYILYSLGWFKLKK